jgi:hypothetical protein
VWIKNGILLTGLTLSQARNAFPTPYVVIFLMFHCSRWEVHIHFVHVGGIFYHHCLNFLFIIYRVRVMVFNVTFNNISVILWRSVLLVRETRVPGENHWPAASHRQTLLHNVVSNTPCGIRTHNISGIRYWLHRS